MSEVLRRHARRLVAALAILVVALVARQPTLDEDERAALASRFAFERHALVGLPVGEVKGQRPMHPDFTRSVGWISSVGGALALADLDGDGAPAEVLHVDTTRDLVVVEDWPRGAPRFAPFHLAPEPLEYDSRTMAPMGTLPGDFDEDGRLDVLVYYWGRTPVLFLRRGAALDADAFTPVELVETRERWFTNAVTQADVDGDGHLDLLVANYFADGARVLDESATDRAYMQDSMTRAANGGGTHLFLGTGRALDDGAPAHFIKTPIRGLPESGRRAWTLALGAVDLDGDQLPEIYMANDFGPDVLLHNRSAPGAPQFAVARGWRSLSMPRSKTLGGDSFKGMGVDFADLDGDGRLDILVSNIATEFGLQESHFAFVHTGDDEAWSRGEAPFVDRSESLGLARDGWGWDVRAADFDNDGVLEVVRATGFLAGESDRWPELHETAMSNDQLIRFAAAWHYFEAGDALSGDEHNPFYVRAESGRYHDLAHELGLDEACVTRAVATADVDRDGDLDLAFGNQWQGSTAYTNHAPASGRSLQLDLRVALRRALTASGPQAAPAPRTRAAIGAVARVKHPDGRVLVAAVDGGGGHSGVESPELHFGLGQVAADAVLEVDIAWRALDGEPHESQFALVPGQHVLVLGDEGGDDG